MAGPSGSTNQTPLSPSTEFRSFLSTKEIAFLTAQFPDQPAQHQEVSGEISDKDSEQTSDEASELTSDEASESPDLPNDGFSELMQAIRDLRWESVPGKIETIKNPGPNDWEHSTEIWPKHTAALERQRHALHFIISEGHKIMETLRLNTMKALVKAIPGNVRAHVINMPGQAGQKALHLAAAHRGPSFAEFLIKHGADVNGKADDDTTPLHCAAKALNRDTTEALLRHIPDPAERLAYDNRLCTPIDKARSRKDEGSDEIIALIQGNHRQDHASNSALLSDVCILQKDKSSKPEDEKISWTLKYEPLLNKPVTEVLDEPFSFLEEFRRRHQLIESDSTLPSTISSKAEHWLSCWIHLPDYNVSEHNLSISCFYVLRKST